MLVPRGEVVYQNLSLSYTDVTGLVAVLETQGFTGTVELNAPSVKGVIFFSRGKGINAQAESLSDGRKYGGEDARERLVALSGQEEGKASVYRFSQDQIDFLSGTLKSEAVFSGLSTDFILLDRLVGKLKEEKHDGYIELFTKAGQPLGALFLKDGDTSDLFIASESGISFFFDQKSVAVFLEGAREQGALINVYRRIAAREGEAHASLGETVTPAGPEVLTPPSFTADTPDKEEDAATITGALQKVLAGIERVVDGLSRQGSFARAFKWALAEKSEIYPFLDPLGDRFAYDDGRLTVGQDVEPERFARGVGECLNLAISNLKKEFPKNIVFSAGLKSEIESSFQTYQETARRLGVESIPPLFLQ